MPLLGFHQVPEFTPFDDAAEWEVRHWDEPEFIVDPLSGLVIAVIPASGRTRRPSATDIIHEKSFLWRSMLRRWLGFASSCALLVVATWRARLGGVIGG
jgi:hypothetical protein